MKTFCPSVCPHCPITFLTNLRVHYLQFCQICQGNTSMSFTKTTGQMEDSSFKKPRTTRYISSILPSSRLAARIKMGQIRTRAAPGCSPGEREATGELGVVGDSRMGKQVPRKPGFVNSPHRTTFLQAGFPMETKFI